MKEKPQIVEKPEEAIYCGTCEISTEFIELIQPDNPFPLRQPTNNSIIVISIMAMVISVAVIVLCIIRLL